MEWLKMIQEWCKPVDAIAVLIIVGTFIMVALGRDGIIKDAFAVVTAFYFGLKTTTNKTPGV